MSDTVRPSERWSRFPMGPQLRKYLGMDEQAYAGADAPARSDEDAAALTRFLAEWHGRGAPRLSDAQVVDLVDELVTMDLPEAALGLAARHPQAIKADDFRAQLALGVAAMLAGELAQAEECLRRAQEVLPAEPAPYVNLVQIFLQQERLDEAEVWANAGLDAEPNNLHLWDLTATVLQARFGEYMPDELLRMAEKRMSWAGISLATGLITTGDRYLKATRLETLYHQGERDAQFLIELTGAYGVAGQYEKIPAVVWQAERMASKGLPWQLHLHVAQAQLALDRNDDALASLAKARKDPMLPPETRDALDELEREAREPTPTMH